MIAKPSSLMILFAVQRHQVQLLKAQGSQCGDMSGPAAPLRLSEEETSVMKKYSLGVETQQDSSSCGESLYAQISGINWREVTDRVEQSVGGEMCRVRAGDLAVRQERSPVQQVFRRSR